MYVFKISYKNKRYQPLVILTLVVNKNSVMFKILTDFAKSKNETVINLDTVFDGDNRRSVILEQVIKSKFKIPENIKLGFIKQVAVNNNRLIKLIRLAEFDNCIKML